MQFAFGLLLAVLVVGENLLFERMQIRNAGILLGT
jgi:hypothetical protein